MVGKPGLTTPSAHLFMGFGTIARCIPGQQGLYMGSTSRDKNSLREAEPPGSQAISAWLLLGLQLPSPTPPSELTMWEQRRDNSARKAK